MPWTGLFFLIGCISISALPPFNGFVSEWLTFQAALQATSLNSGVLRAVVPIAAAILALTGALAAACFVKVFGIAFLGQARNRRVRHAHEANTSMVVSLGFLAFLCLLLGVLPTTVIIALNGVSSNLTGAGLTMASSRGWLWLTPIAPQVASYSAPLILVGIILTLSVWVLVYLALRQRRRTRPVIRRDPWDCGFGSLNPRMQYSASAFAMPFKVLFGPLFRIHEESERQMDEKLPTLPARLSYQIHTDDIIWVIFYRPFKRSITFMSRQVARIQTGHLRHYLAYSFVTLLFLLWLVS
jgi:NADH:ubiquinone oxidoreductase subunit 5 (subunit L)/multisubunit Na+/H+ antiporter MnhA subunit